MTIRTLGLVLGLAWMMSSRNGIGPAFRFGLDRQLNLGSAEWRTGTSRQGNSGLRTGGQSSPGGRAHGLGQPVGLGEPAAQPQGREFQEQSFVGRDAEDVRDTFRNLTRGQRRRAMMDMVVENLNEMRESRRRWRDQQRQPPSVRVQLRPAFDYPGVAVDRVALEVQTRLTAVMQKRQVYHAQRRPAGPNRHAARLSAQCA